MHEQILSCLQRALPSYAIGNDLASTTDIVDELGVDSLDMLNVATALEKDFGVAVADHEWRELRTVQSIAGLLAQRRKN